MSKDIIPNQVLTLTTIIGGLICIYLSNTSLIGGILSIILALIATIFGTNTLRHVGKYSLGTGVPSIVYMLTAVGLVSYILGIIITIKLNQPIIFPIIMILTAIIISLIISLICKHLFKIQVEILTKSFIFLAVASSLIITAMSTLIAQTYYPQVIYDNVIQNGIVLLLMIMSVMAVQNPYNSCMGPNEDQYRTLTLALANISLMLIIVSVISISYTQYWTIYLILSLIIWAASFSQYTKYTKHQAASIRRYGLWPKDDGEN